MSQSRIEDVPLSAAQLYQGDPLLWLVRSYFRTSHRRLLVAAILITGANHLVRHILAGARLDREYLLTGHALRSLMETFVFASLLCAIYLSLPNTIANLFNVLGGHIAGDSPPPD